jgi:hypothetical protein
MAITDPTDITGLQLWLNPGSITGKSDGDSVTTVPDDSGNNYDAADESGTNPVYDDGSRFPHGKPGVRYGNRTSQRLEVSATKHGGSLDLGTYTYVVIKYTEVATSNAFCIVKDLNGTPTTPGLRHDVNSYSDHKFDVVDKDSGSNNIAIVPEGNRGVFTDIHVIQYDGTNLTYRINGAEVGSATGSGHISDGGGTGPLVYGNHPTADVSSPGVLYDVIVYDSALALSDVQDLESWARDKFPYDWTFNGKLFSDELPGNTFIDGSTAYLFSINRSDERTFYYRTAPTSDPFNWSARTQMYTSSVDTRAACCKKHNGTWYLYFDDRLNGGIKLATSSDLLSWTDAAGGGDILTGSGSAGQDDEFVRYPYVFTPSDSHDGGWHLLIDGRADNPREAIGAIYHYTGTDSETWTQESKILDGTGNTTEWNRSDVGAMSAVLIDGTYQIIFQAFNELDDNRGADFPHYLGRATSTDLTAANTNLQTDTPFLPYDYGGVANVSNGNPIGAYDPGDGNFYVIFLGSQRQGGTETANIVYATSDTIAGTDTLPPTVDSATVNTAGDQVTVRFDDSLAGTTAAADWTVRDETNAEDETINSASISGTDVILSLGSTIFDSETVTVDYDGTSDLKDSAGNQVASFTDQAVTNNSTQTGGDTTAPVLTNASGTSTGQNTASISVDTDEGNGTLYWVVDQSQTAPSVAQIQAGNGSDGSAADDSGGQSVSSSGTQSTSASGLSAGTTYYAHFQHQDSVGNDSGVVSSASFTTTSPGSYTNFIFGPETSFTLTQGFTRHRAGHHRAH